MNEHHEEPIGGATRGLSQSGGDISSASVDDGSTYHKAVQNREDFTRSASPFIQGLSTQLSSQSLAQNLERPATLRQLPIRAVFDDLQTAHNLITTGSARNASGFRYRTPSNNAPSFTEDESSIALQELEPEDDSSSNLLSGRPSPAAVSTSRHRSIPSDLEGGCIRPGSWLAQTPGIIESLDHAAAIASFPIPSTDHALSHTLRPSGTFDSVDSVSPSDSCSQTMDSPDAKATQGVNNSSCYHSGFGAPSSDTLPPNFPRYTHANSYAYYHPPANDGSSLRDGSTVGNIYKHYVGSVYCDSQSEVSADSQELPPYKPPLKQPNHRLNVQQVPTSTSQGASHASSYGDIQKLLEITKGSKTAQNQPLTFDRNGNQTSRGGPSSIDSIPAHGRGLEKISNRNMQGLQVVVHPASNENSTSGDYTVAKARAQDRVPLEKEVSRALRRASGYSAYSAGSISTTPQERYIDPPSETSTYRAIKSLLRRNAEITSPSDTGSLGNNANHAGHQAQGFYDQRAIASKHISTQQRTVVRVPIHQLALPDSPPSSPACDVDTPFSRGNAGPTDDPNDWETVGESTLGRPIPDFLGGTVGQAGSSIANLSDDDVRELRSFGSTDRIAQHPGNIEYSGDYRQRDLKKSHIPVFLPVYKEHKVNGYLADSNRIRQPPNLFYKTPPPLQGPHKNPFQNPPPQLPSQRRRNTNRFPPATLPNAQQDPVVVDSKFHDSKSKAHAVQGSFQNSNWMDEYGEPGPVFTNQVLRMTTPEYSNADNVVLSFDSEHRSQDYRLFNSSSERDSQILEWRSRQKHQTDGSVEMETYGGTIDTNNQRERKPFVKGPPGAFYRGLRAVSTGEGKRARGTTQRGRHARAPTRTSTRKGSVNDFPTNTLRPLSLLADRRPVTPTDQIAPSPDESMENDFVYRSPLAPPLRSSWQQLYSKGQMNGFREAAKADGFFSSRSSIPGVLRQPDKNTSTQKHLFEVPRLAAFSRHSSNQTGLIHQKKNVSTIILCFCALFPPLLLLYTIGALDSLMSWWTSGQCSTFGKAQKKVALIMVWIWGLVLFLMLVAFLVVWFVILH